MIISYLYMYKKYIKNTLDFLAAIFLLLILSPLFVIISIVLMTSNNKRIFFIQERIGLHNRPFNILKFKTMNDKVDEKGNLLPNEERLTGLGKIIRKTSLDELPQLMNVLFGQMSFVGPRPLHKRYLPYYTSEESKRHAVKPGITGLAQISGRNLMEWDAKLAKDVEYIEKISFSIDVLILVKTIFKVFRPSDVILESTEGLDEYRERIGYY